MISKEELERIADDKPQLLGDGTAKRVATYALTLLGERDALRDAAARLCCGLEQDVEIVHLEEPTRSAYRELSALVSDAPAVGGEAGAVHTCALTAMPLTLESVRDACTACRAEFSKDPSAFMAMRQAKPPTPPAPEPRVIKPGDVLRWEPDTRARMTVVKFDDAGRLMVTFAQKNGRPTASVPTPIVDDLARLLVHADGTPSRYPEPAPKPEAPHHSPDTNNQGDNHEQGISGAHAQQERQGQSGADSKSVRPPIDNPDHATEVGARGRVGGNALPSRTGAGNRADEIGGSLLLREEGDGERHGEHGADVAPKPEAPEPPASVWVRIDDDDRERGTAYFQPCDDTPEYQRNHGFRVAGPYVRATTDASDEERARALHDELSPLFHRRARIQSITMPPSVAELADVKARIAAVLLSAVASVRASERAASDARVREAYEKAAGLAERHINAGTAAHIPSAIRALAKGEP